jgi:hypothetical protein
MPRILDDNMKTKMITIVFLSFLLLSIVFAQETKIKLRNTGFGKTAKDVYFTLHNVGETIITNVTIFIDGNEFNTMQGTIPPGKGFEFILFMDPGQHLIEARTPDGAKDSVVVTVSPLEEKKYVPPEKPKSFLEENIVMISLIALIIIIVIIAWLFTRRPKLKA